MVDIRVRVHGPNDERIADYRALLTEKSPMMLQPLRFISNANMGDHFSIILELLASTPPEGQWWHLPSSSSRLLDIIGATAKDKRLWMRDDCDGSSNCCVELHIERIGSMHENEIHLTYEEAKMIRRALKAAMIRYKGQWSES